ncbi:unnamed protein product [Peronospora destructor]|uniref:Uncharacterized protein n=1 Tax=Peronospora destructor TaxID=86335 RepID=A0AAV0TGY6_9STRA|nr:unnamed protein product [Peronospora destructor]
MITGLWFRLIPVPAAAVKKDQLRWHSFHSPSADARSKVHHEKVVRCMRGLRKGRRSSGRKEHRIDDDMLAACKVSEGLGVVLPNCIDAWPSPQQHPTISSTTEFMVDLPLDSAPTSMSPDGADSNGIADTVQTSAVLTTLCQLPTIDESLDFLIECLSTAS